MNVFDPEFFPTPKEIIARMVTPYADRITTACILEPSAGNGAILDYLKEGVPKTYTHPNGKCSTVSISPDMKRVYACEHNPELQMILHKKGYRLVAEDFLQYRPDIRFNLAIMNPPFRNGDQHLLHAWDIMPSGDIVCLLNAETVNNPYTENRKRLKRIIDEHGSVEQLGPCFRSADNPTDVEVVLVRLHKDAKEDPFVLNPSGLTEEEMPDFEKMSTEGNSLIQESRLDAFIRAWRMAKLAAIDYIKARQTLQMYIGAFTSNSASRINPIGELDQHMADSANQFKDNPSAHMEDGYNHFIDSTTRLVWETVFKQIGLGKYMTSNLRESMNAFQQGQSSYAVTKENIMKLFQFIMLNVGEIMDRAVVEVYDQFTRYFPDNTSWKEGWKTNKQFFCNRKVILPNVAECGFMPQRYGYSRFFSVSYYASQTLDDIDKAMCWLCGRNFDDLTGEIYVPGQGKTPCPAASTIRGTLYRIPVGSTEWHESAFFKVKAFKKGTIHIEFKDEALWTKFNLTVNKGKNQIGDSEAA